MSARVTASMVQNCLHAACAARVERMGTGRASAELAVDPKTLRRHRDHGGWSDAEIAALVAYEMQEQGTSAILDAVVAITHGETASQRGEAVRVREDLVRELDDDAQVDRVILKNLDRSTADGRRAVRDAIAKRREHENELLADLDAQDRTHGGARP